MMLMLCFPVLPTKPPGPRETALLADRATGTAELLGQPSYKLRLRGARSWRQECELAAAPTFTGPSLFSGMGSDFRYLFRFPSK